MLRIRPGSQYFAGREALIEKVVGATRRSNAVLLFGGRQSGKTSLLLKLRERLASERADVGRMSAIDIPVYVDLTTLPYEASPQDFFELLAVRADRACREQVTGFSGHDIVKYSTLDDFAGALVRIRKGGGQVEIRYVFLLDEAKRVLSDRFPRGFQDNLFALLFGEVSDEVNAAMIFAGTQHLMEFCRDETSPIGSRAIPLHIRSLERDDVAYLAALALPKFHCAQLDEFVGTVLNETGGHAGLVARFLETACAVPVGTCEKEIVEAVLGDCLGLFDIWTGSLTREAQQIALDLSSRGQMVLQDVANRLAEKGLNRFLVRPAVEELSYTGIGVVEQEYVRPSGEMFWRYFAKLGAARIGDDIGNEDGEAVWKLIKQTELALRELVRAKFSAKFGDGSLDAIRRILGEKAWTEIQAVKDKSDKQYKFSRLQSVRDLMSCMYLGQLGALMVSGDTWGLFKDLFRDKRELEDKLAAIFPVRNDCAHFCPAPEKELSRCRIACDDLLVIVERELQVMNG